LREAVLGVLSEWFSQFFTSSTPHII